MTEKINIDRRRLLQLAGTTAIGLFAYPDILMGDSYRAGNKASADFHADVELELKLEAVQIPIFPGNRTRVWKVFGKLLKGSPGSLTNMSGSYMAPIIRIHKGQKVRIFLRNNLPGASILHWHGLHVPAEMDGNPIYAINTGESYVYEFKILKRAGSYWYHAHTHSVTAKQVYSGLAGLFIVSDDEEQALELPRGDYDVPIVIQDRSFNNQNQLVYISHMMQRMRGFLGNRIMINGLPDFVLPVSTRAYRLRLLNGSNSRIYKLAWNHGGPVTVIGVDGGLLTQPENYPYVMLAPGERVDLWADFSGLAMGTELILESRNFALSMHGMMGGGMMGRGRRGMMSGGTMGHNALPSGGNYPVLKIRVTKQSVSSAKLPARLADILPLQIRNAANRDNPRRITLSMGHMSALLNNRSYKMNDVRNDEIIPVNTLQLIEFDNGYHRGMHGMMAMPHPMHLHGEQFQIVKREIDGRSENHYQTVAEGLVDSGWKDTVMVMPGEKVTLLKPFNDFTGLFMYHCHNLEHEDLGMMRDFLIQ